MSVPISPGRGFDSGPPRVVFNEAGVSDLDTTPDGTRFPLIREISAAPLKCIVVALGTAAEIGRRAP